MKKASKRIVCIAMVLVFVMSSMTISAMGDDGICVELNGEQITVDVKPQMIDNTIMVPIRKILSALGTRIEWDNITNTIIGQKNYTKVIMQINKKEMIVDHTEFAQNNYKVITLDVPPQIVGSQTLVPLRAVAEGFDAKVSWDYKTQTVSITADEEESTSPISTKFTSQDLKTVIKQNGLREYSEDYTVKYKKLLDAMFDSKWTVISKDETTAIPEDCCDINLKPYKYIEWTIQYTDGNGNLQSFILNNRDDLSEQIQYYVADYVAAYYEKNFFDTYLDGTPLAQPSYVFGFIDHMTIDRDDIDNAERVTMTEKYIKNLATPEGTICFSKMTPANAFKMCPMYLSICIDLDDGLYSAQNKQKLEEYTKKQVELMIDAMNRFANNKMNAEINVDINEADGALYDGEDYWGWNYIQGINKNVYDALYFERDVYDSYKGLFW